MPSLTVDQNSLATLINLVSRGGAIDNQLRRSHSATWEIALPDLRTRLAITPIARIERPDDALFGAVIRLLFADRGLHIPDEALKYIADRVERSYWMAERVVDAIDRFAIAERSRLTLPTIRRALGEGGIIDARGAA